MSVMKKQRLLAVLTVLLALAAVAAQRPMIGAAQSSEARGKIAFEIIGQVANPAANRTLAYGYLSFIEGLAPEAIAAGGDLNERTARFTFFVDTVNTRVINNGPLRAIDRAGSMGIYLDTSSNQNWSDPRTFHDGDQILGADLRYQVIIDTLTGAFSASWDLTSAWSKRFETGGTSYRLGTGPDQFIMTVSGHLNPQAPPAAHIAGFARGLELHR